jgi:hypothetical protein
MKFSESARPGSTLTPWSTLTTAATASTMDRNPPRLSLELLNLIDNTDFLKPRSYNSGYANNAEHVRILVNGIIYQDIMLDGKNLSSAIRRHMFGMKQHGAKGRRSKSYKKNKKGKGINYKKSKTYKKRIVRNKNKK